MRLKLSRAEQALSEKEKIARAANAKRIFDDPMFREAVESYKQRLHDELETSKPDQSEERERLYLQILALKVVVGRLLEHIQSGQIAEKRLSNWKNAV